MQYGGIQNSPLGKILVIDDGNTILEVRFLDYTPAHKGKSFPKSTEYSALFSKQSPLTLAVFLQLQEYFCKKRQNFTLPLNPNGTAFQQNIWRALCTIPYGTTSSYGDIAKLIEHPKSARAIGNANHKNPIAILIPCHRVISANGDINGYSGGIQRKIALLKLEGYKSKKQIIK